MSKITKEKFPLGRIVTTANVARQLSQEEIHIAMGRHAAGDWGNASGEDKKLNDEAIESGYQIMSVYVSQEGVKFWIITEADRSATTVLLPEDY